MTDDVREEDVWLTPYDMDHLEHGAPVYKGIGDDLLVILRAADWDTLKRMEPDDD